MLFDSIKKVENQFLKMLVEKVYNCNIELIEEIKKANNLKKEIDSIRNYINKMNNKKRNNNTTRKENIIYNEVLEIRNISHKKDYYYNHKIKVEINKSMIKDNIKLMNKYIENHDIKNNDIKVIYDIIEYLKSENVKNGIEYII